MFPAKTRHELKRSTRAEAPGYFAGTYRSPGSALAANVQLNRVNAKTSPGSGGP
jgi:hypothetical protein